ncbi:uncharacterized protein BT62DRAFT_888159 [Guyanagaster necrorhizus]|uniref:RRN7-type domain-containing protein n=1 Tax=Guyanagaster necrorhizus TaxID=856835 RepID=A0A9P7VYK9_9AGAR|nr:uncharacterized protein BT62DRAFT_888159 [Guyanagaster necrorhizus MCA 3950]KAG7449110.1 hypothetical protein BT62DRAFT_888159 [Guyanagaster necrorhizus MCA 3950]
MAPRRRCPVCQSRQWHKEPSSGLIACSEGHILQNYRNETTTEAEDLGGAHAMLKRTIKSGRKKAEDVGIGRANPQLYHGARGTYLYFQCLQIIFRKQIAALTKVWNLPSEFELVCRDIWTLNLTLLPEHPPPEPYHYVHGENAGSQDDDDQDPSSDENDEDGDDDRILATLHADTSSESELEDEDGDGVRRGEAKQPRKKRSPDRYRSLTSTIAVLMLACWTMRIPVMFRDFISAIEAYDLPYLDPVRLLPPTMVAHLTRAKIQSLSMQRPPRTLTLHKLTSRLTKKMHALFGVSTPELNAAPLLWRVTRVFGGNPTLYQLTKQLARLLSLPLSVSYALAPGLERLKENDPEHRMYDHVPVEVGFVAVTIIALKMVYGLDGVQRVRPEPGDPGLSLPAIDEYLEYVGRLSEEDIKEQSTMFSSESQMSVGDLDELMLDEYVSFCERALLGGENDGDGMVAKYFPLKGRKWKDLPDSETEIPCGKMQGSRPDEDGQGDRPGEKYKVFIGTDSGGSVAAALEMVVRRGAGYIKVSEEDVFSVTERCERRLLSWWKKQRKTNANIEEIRT